MNRKLSRQQGQGLVEYALILALIAIIVIATVMLLGQGINQIFARIVLQLQYPGNYSGDPVTASGVNASANGGCPFGECSVTASVNATINGASGSPSICAQFSVSGGGSQVACGSPPSATISGGGNSGSVTACIIAVEGHSLVGGPYCSTVTY